jgi:hypothetical protein
MVADFGVGIGLGARVRCVAGLSGLPRRGGVNGYRSFHVHSCSPLGCTEAIMLAHGFTVETLGRLVLDGLAPATPGIMYAGGRQIKVTWLRITDVGRQAIAGA